MILGNNECDSELAYFLEYGELKPYERNNCKYGLTENDIDYHFHEKKEDEFICWQGSQIPNWLQ